MDVAKQSTAAQVAKRAAVFALVVAVISPALDFALGRLHPEGEEPNVMYIAFGVCCGLLCLAALGACFVACIACVVNRLSKGQRTADNRSA